jgi:hypothetical protein
MVRLFLLTQRSQEITENPQMIKMRIGTKFFMARGYKKSPHQVMRAFGT